MSKISKYKLTYVGPAVGSLGALALPGIAHAQDCSINDPNASAATGAQCAQGNGQPSDLATNFKNITNTLLFIIGLAAVIMLIIGGFRYIFSAGDQNAVSGAKNTILYAIVGIVVALLAYAIVNFVIGRFSG